MTVEFAPPAAVERSLRAEWARLAGLPAASDRFAVDQTDDLPEPARRRLAHVIAPGTPLYRGAQLVMRGQIKIGRWRRFTACQVLAPPSGFIWAATARIAGLPVTGFDRYTFGTGQMRWRLAGLVPVLNGAGPDVSRSAAGRFAGEATCWLPTSFRSARWAPGPDADTAVATWMVDGEGEAIRIRVGPDGRLTEALMQRWGNPDGQPFGRYPFGVAVEAERTFGGVRIPSSIRAGWGWGTDRQDAGEFFRAEITGATFR
jgi:hypothetical protein